MIFFVQIYIENTHVPYIYSLESFDTEVKALTDKYRALPLEAQSNELLLDFETRWKRGREKLSLKLSRGRV